MRNTAFGVFNSLGKIAGTAAQTMSVLTQDDEWVLLDASFVIIVIVLSRFQQDRQRFAQRNRPVHMGDGVAVGAASFGRGILSGISGLVLKPVEAVEQEVVDLRLWYRFRQYEFYTCGIFIAKCEFVVVHYEVRADENAHWNL